MIPNKKFVLSVHYNGDNSYLFINSIQQYKFKTKNSEIKPNKLNLGNISDNDHKLFFIYWKYLLFLWGLSTSHYKQNTKDSLLFNEKKRYCINE